MEMSEAPISST